MRKLLAPAVVLGLLIGAFGAAGVAGAADSATPGVTKDEIKLGVTYVDLSKIKDIVHIDHGDYEKTFTAVIDDLNKSGGINGRKVVPVFAPVDPVGTVPAQDACVKLTEDQQVFAALGFFLDDAPLCYLEQHATPVLSGTMTKEYLARAKAPWFTLEPGDATVSKVVQGLVAEGAFKKQKVGVVALGADQPVMDDVVMPVLKKNNVKATTAVIDVPPSDTVAAQDQAATIVERFKSDGITTVLVVGNALVGIGDAVAKTDYRPRLVATNSDALKTYAQSKGSDPAVLKNAISGNIGINFNDPALQKCYKSVEQATGDTIVENPPPNTPSYRSSADNACRYIALFAAIAKAAGKNLTVASFGKAATKMGTVEIPGAGAISYDPKTHEMTQPIYIFRYDPTQKAVVQDAKPIS